jgi:hypothetical protein
VEYDPKTTEKKMKPIPIEKVQINEEFDSFEITEKFEGSRTYKEVIGYESSIKTIFIPNLSMREGFLLIKGILPTFHIYEECSLELKKVPFPKRNYILKISENCSFEIEIGKNENEITSLKITNVDFAYAGFTLVKVEGGLEISQFYAL